MTVEQVTEPAQAGAAAGPLASGGPCIGAGPAGPDGPLCGLPDRGGHRRHGGAVLRQVPGDWNALLNALFAADVRKVSHNVKDLTRTLLENGLPAEGFVFDTALAAYLLDATAGSYDLARLFVAYFNEELPKALYLEPDAFLPAGDAAAAEASFDSYAAAVDALYGALAERLAERGQMDLLHEIEMPLCAVLAEMETAGCRVDARALGAFGDLLARRAPSWNSRSTPWRGRNSTSTPQAAGEILFGKLGLPHGKRPRPAGPPTPMCWKSSGTRPPIVGAVLEYRQYAKLKSTYADGLFEGHGPGRPGADQLPDDGDGHGPLSSTEPNLQNIPTRTDLGSEIRRMFIPAEGCVLVDADYSQIELRLLAHMAGDEAMHRRPSAPAGTSTRRRRPRCSTWRRTR